MSYSTSSDACLAMNFERSSPEDIVDYITVSDPVIHAEGINKYTSYRVDCRPPNNYGIQENNSGSSKVGTSQDPFLQISQSQYSSVLRRYSDFLWLYERLHKERAGSIVPHLPEKQAVGKFSPEFVEERRKALEKFLRRVVIHPELYNSNCLLSFLRADDVTFAHTKTHSEKMDIANHENLEMSTSLGGAGAFNLSPKNASGIKKWFSEAKTTFSGDLVTSPDDDLFDEIERYIEALAIQMKRVTNQAIEMVRKSRELANGLFEFGLAFHQLGQSEGEDLGKKLQLMGGTADNLSSMAAIHADQEWKKLEEPFKDYLKVIQAVKLSLNRRHNKRISYTALLHEIQNRETNVHRLRMTPGSEGKAYSLEMSLQRYQAAAEVAREEYVECSQRVLREVDRFKREKAEEMKSVVLDFILLEIEVNRNMEKVWGELIPKLEGSSDLDFDGEKSVNRRFDAAQPEQPQNQPTMVIMPPSYPPPAVPSMLSQPVYSNVSALSGPDSFMESSIQYRDNNLPGMGL